MKSPVILINDEKYFTFTNDNKAGNDGYCTSDKETVPDNVKYVPEQKFEHKILVWVD